MIAFRRLPAPAQPAWHAAFLALLPTILNYVRPAFRHLRPADRAEAVQEAVANTCVAYYARLVEQGRQERAFATVLARFAVAQVRAGRKVGTSANSRDVMSWQAQQRHKFAVHPFHHFDRGHGGWREAVAGNSRTPVVDQVAFRLDFPAWLGELSRRDRRVAQLLAKGHSTSDVARRFRISAARVSQLRRELHQSWQQFHGELQEAST